jgi:SAM-dependent methyltransferase
VKVATLKMVLKRALRQPHGLAAFAWRRLMHTEDVDALRLSVKALGYQLARELSGDLEKITVAGEPRMHGISSKACTQADVASPWFVHWCSELHIKPFYHRKLWEFAFTLQAMYEAGLLQQGRRGFGFGCGEEPLPAFFAARGIDTVATDLDPARVAGMGWAETQQHASSRDKLYYPDIVARETFDRHVALAYVDMNNIPVEHDGKFDFCWSICAMEHVGSIELGLRFVKESLRVLKPGGVAIHTTEFNFEDSGHTVDHWMTVLFQRRHFEELARRLAREGHTLVAPSFDVGRGALDGFIDVPPYAFGRGGWISRDHWHDLNVGHLKLAVHGHPTTCYGLIVRKSGA